MSAGESFLRGLRDTFFVMDNMKRLATGVDRLDREVRDQDRRLIRLEAIIEVGLRRGSPRLTDE